MTNAESSQGFVQAATAEAGTVPLPIVVAVSVVLILVGAALAVIGWRGLQEKLPRNRFAGVRTPATLRSDEAFRVGNRAAGLPTMVSGVIGILTAVALLGLSGPAQWVALAIGVLGVFGLVAAGGVLGTRAAALVPDKPARKIGCAGQCCGSNVCGIA